MIIETCENVWTLVVYGELPAVRRGSITVNHVQFHIFGGGRHGREARHELTLCAAADENDLLVP